MAREKEDTKVLGGRLFCVSFFVLCFYFVFKYAIGALFPFLLAYSVSLVITPASKKTAEKTGIPQKLCAAVYVSLAIGAIAAVTVFGISRLIEEVRELVSGGESELSEINGLLEAIESPVESILKKLGGGGEGAFEKMVGSIESKIFEAASTFLTDTLSGAVSKAPSIFIGGAVTVLSTYYFCIDGTKIKENIKKALPEKYRGSVIRTLSLGALAVKKYAKAYLFLMLMTFVEVFVGLSVLKVKYAFLLALGISTVDILPVLGAGSILLPWAAAVLFMGRTSLGLGLIILYGTITLVRQIVEPAVVGSTIGLHPIAALFSTYAGLYLFGIVGMIAGPAVVFVAFEMLKKRE